MSFRQSIRFVLSGFVFLNLIQLAHARDELPKEVVDLFAKMDTAAQKPFAEVTRRSIEYELDGEQKEDDCGESTTVFIDPKRFQFRTTKNSDEELTLIGNGEECFGISHAYRSYIIHDTAKSPNLFFLNKLPALSPNLAISLLGSSRLVLAPSPDSVVSIHDDAIDGIRVIRFERKEKDWLSIFYIDPTSYRVVLVKVESLEKKPGVVPSTQIIHFVDRHEPTADERNFCYTSTDYERAWKELSASTGRMAFPPPYVIVDSKNVDASARQPSPTTQVVQPATDPLPAGWDEIPANVDELLEKIDEAYQSPTLTTGKIARETEIYGKLEQDSTPFELTNNAPKLYRYSYNEKGYRRLLIGNSQSKNVFLHLPDSLSYGSEEHANRDVTEFTKFNPLLAIALSGSARKTIFPEGTKFVSLDEFQNEGERSLTLVTVDGIRTRTYKIDRDTNRITCISMKPGVVQGEYPRLPVRTIVNVTSERLLTTEEQTKTYDKAYLSEQWSEFQSYKFSKRERGPVVITGDRAPEFEGADIDGNPIKLSDYNNKVILLSFWYVGCKPCINEMVHLKQLVNELKNPDLVVLTINIDTADDHATVVDRVKRCMAHYELDFPTILDEEQKIWDLYNADVLPTAVIIGRDGVIRGTLDRWDENSDEPIRAALADTE